MFGKVLVVKVFHRGDLLSFLEAHMNMVEVIDIANKLLYFIMTKSPNKTDFTGREGGYFCLAQQDGTIHYVHRVGKVKLEKMERYPRLAAEKALRLGNTPLHRRSYQSRDPQHDKWGGAVRGKRYIWSFSGFT